MLLLAADENFNNDIVRGLLRQKPSLENITSNDICQVIVVHDVTPTIEEYAKEQGIHLYWSYDL